MSPQAAIRPQDVGAMGDGLVAATAEAHQRGRYTLRGEASSNARICKPAGFCSGERSVTSGGGGVESFDEAAASVAGEPSERETIRRDSP